MDKYLLFLIIAFMLGISLGLIVAGGISNIEFEKEMRKNIEIFNRECRDNGFDYDFNFTLTILK